MNTLFSKLREFVGINEPVEYEEYYEEEAEVYQQPPTTTTTTTVSSSYQEESPQSISEESRRNRRRDRPSVTPEIGIGTTTMNNVIGMPGSSNGVSEVIVMEPRSFEEMPQAIQALRERKSVVLNLTIMDPDQAQRAVDFVAGGTYAIDGHQERIGESIFLFTPSCVQVSTQSGGVVHEVSPPARNARPAAPAPAWANEQVRMAQ